MPQRTIILAACDMIRSTVHSATHATLNAHEGPRKDLAHIAAADALRLAASEMAHAALDIASGCPIVGHAAPFAPNPTSLANSLLLAEAKLNEAKALLAKAEARRAAKEARRAA